VEITMRDTGRTRWAGLLLAAALGLSACGRTTVARILAEPERYTRKGDVRLEGDVVESVSFLGRGAFKLDDGTGTIWIISGQGVPRRGAQVKVNGRIRDVVDVSTIMRLPEQIGSGLVMTDARARAR
jgi:membrane protein implicated in regulation of membrane protease activity